MDADGDKVAAAVLAVGLMHHEHARVSFTADVTPTVFAAQIYFDCLEAIRTARARRPRVQSENSEM
jgi:hypothetical protein